MHTTLVVTDAPLAVAGTVRFAEYLAQYPKKGEKRTRIINVCDTAQYLSQGYYCALLAEARGHQVIPSVRTITQLALMKPKGCRVPSGLLPEGMQTVFYVCFGKTQSAGLAKVAKWAFEQFPAPILALTPIMHEGSLRLCVEALGLSNIPESEQTFFQAEMAEFTQKVWRIKAPAHARFTMAIVIDDDPSNMMPSNPKALKKFVRAAKSHGIAAEVIPASELTTITAYDAVFMRKNTAIEDISYQLALAADAEGLVVMDSPSAILRCCNKVYLHDAFSYQGVKTPKTRLLTQMSEVAALPEALGFPVILKLPDSAFSKGVFKAANMEALTRQVSSMLADSAVVIAQQYVYTDFDWRIGVLDGKPLYACRYYMAKNHWQIYDHGAKTEGGFDTLPTFEVPKAVLKAAVKAAKMIGDGLFGVDLKEVDGEVLVVEVNDNPNIDAGIEDAYLGDELYNLIMASFARKLVARVSG